MFFFDLLPFYAILRSIPNKLVGVIAMFAAILALLLLPVMDVSRSRGMQFRPLSKIAFFIFVANFLLLMQLGAKHVESPFIEFGQISTVIYFLYFTFVIYCLTMLENTLVDFSLSGIGNHSLPSLYTRNILLTELLKSGTAAAFKDDFTRDAAASVTPVKTDDYAYDYDDGVLWIELDIGTKHARWVPIIWCKYNKAFMRSFDREIYYTNDFTKIHEELDNERAVKLAYIKARKICQCYF